MFPPNPVVLEYHFWDMQSLQVGLASSLSVIAGPDPTIGWEWVNCGLCKFIPESPFQLGVSVALFPLRHVPLGLSEQMVWLLALVMNLPSGSMGYNWMDTGYLTLAGPLSMPPRALPTAVFDNLMRFEVRHKVLVMKLLYRCINSSISCTCWRRWEGNASPEPCSWKWDLYLDSRMRTNNELINSLAKTMRK